MHKVPLKILFLLAPIFIITVFVIDGFMFVTDFDLSFVTISFRTFREILLIVFILSCLIIIKRLVLLEHLNLGEKLWRMAIFLTINFIFALILSLSLSPTYTDTMPPHYGNFHALIYSNMIGILAIVTLIPILLIVRELIFYKQRRTTRLYFNLFLVILLLSSIWVYANNRLLNIRVLLFQFEDSNFYNTIFVWSLVIITFFLSLRNDWITYLPRKQKFLFFGVGLLVYAQITTLWDIYHPHILAYSYLVSTFAYITYYFLILYGGISMLTLLVHLPTSRAVDRKLKEVQSLYNFARMLNSELNFQKISQLITHLTAQVLESQSTWLELFNPTDQKLKVVSHMNLTQQQILQNPLDELAGFNQALIDRKKPLLINDLTQHKQFRHLIRWKKDARAFIAAPLFSNREQLMGIIYASKATPYGFDIDDVSLLEGFANQAAIALENANLWESSIERERLEQELKVARDVQLKLVPQKMPLIRNMELESYFLTAYEVGGDYYDFIEYVDQQPGVVIGDVSGKGTSAAFYMAEFKGVIQTLARTLDDPKALICHANRIFYSTIERQSFVTAIIGKFTPQENRFQFVRAGHTPVLYCSQKNGGSTYLQPPGLAIGLEHGKIFDKTIAVEEVYLQPGDALLLFTDGLIELRNKAGEEFGEERLKSLLDGCRDTTAIQIKDKILHETNRFIGNTPLHDDLTLIVIKCKKSVT